MSPLRPSLAALRSRLSSSSSLGSTRVEAAVACSPSAGSSINSRSLSSTRARRSSTLVNLSLLFGGATLGLGYATIFPSPLSRLLNPPIAPPSPVQHSPEGLAHTQDIEAQLQSLDQVKALRAEQEPSQSAPTSLTPESQLLRQPRWKESRPYLKYPEERRTHHLTAGLLRGPGKLAVAPLAFSTQDDKETIIFIHLGRSLCGHDGIVHGGLLSTLLDEGLARPAFFALPAKLGVTANLNVDFKSPCFADQFVVLRSKLTEASGRKAWSEGRMETLDGTVIVKAKALYIQPKMAALLENSAVSHAMGDDQESME